MDFAADFFGETIATLDPPGLREIVMETREGIDAWMRSIQGKPLPPSVRLPSFDVPPFAID